MFDQVQERFGRLDFFVSNASASNFHHFMDLKPHHLERTFNLNVRAFVVGTQRAVRLMPDGGRVVVLSSYGSIRTFPTYANLGSAKAALETWARYMAVELAPLGVNVNAVNGGIIETDSSSYFYATGRVPSLETVLPEDPQEADGQRRRGRRVRAVPAVPGGGVRDRDDAVVDGGLTVDRAAVPLGHGRRRRRDARRAVRGAPLAAAPRVRERVAGGRDRPAGRCHTDRDGLDAPRARGSRRRRGGARGVLRASARAGRIADRHRWLGGQPGRRRRTQLQLRQRDADARQARAVAAAVHDAGGLVVASAVPRRPVRVRGVVRADAGGAVGRVFAATAAASRGALSGDEVLETIEDFARGARRARELGFDGVEIMGSEGYLIDQFLAPATNLRDDEWGGDLGSARMRFALAVADAVRAAGGPGQAVVFRMSGRSLVQTAARRPTRSSSPRPLASGGRGRRLQRRHRLARVAGANRSAHWCPTAPGDRGRERSRTRSTCPVIASNRINTIALAEEALARRRCRLCLDGPAVPGRPGDREQGARRAAPTDQPVHRLQPGLHRPLDLRQAGVVRGQSARRLRARVRLSACAGQDARARRGRRRRPRRHGGGARPRDRRPPVSLFEASDRLGGQFRMACRIPGKEDFALTIAYFEAELARLGVSVHRGSPVRDAGAVADFDCVVVATGVLPRPVDLPGADLPHVVSYAELLRDGGAWGERVAIIGAGGIGVDVAHLVSHRDVDFYASYGLDPPGRPARAPAPPARAHVTLMRRGTRVGERIGPSTRWAVVQELRMAGVEILTGVAYERIEPGAVVDSRRGRRRASGGGRNGRDRRRPGARDGPGALPGRRRATARRDRRCRRRRRTRRRARVPRGRRGTRGDRAAAPLARPPPAVQNVANHPFQSSPCAHKHP